VQYFNVRYKALERLLRNRQELTNVTSINRVLRKTDRSHLSLIGAIQDKQTTKNDNIMLTIEDPTGAIKVLVNKNKPDIYESAKDLVLDQIVGITGVNGDKIVFANSLIQPDAPQKELKRCDEEVCAAILSDLHVGSNNFLAEDFGKFVDWINLRKGNEKQQDLAKKVKYLFIVGDLIDGCGIYPEQDKELIIKDISKQYEECARLLSQIPPHVNIIICPGNHDAMRIAEPQPPLYKDFAGPIYELPNVTLVSNPAVVNIQSSETFPGFDVLMYHGYSFDFFVANVDSIRNSGGYDRADLIMKFLLRKRHLAPTHTSTLYIPDTAKDPLVIDKVPDLFITGHIHKSIVANYKNVTMVCGSCWQSKTTFQERVGHNPEPSRVPIINLKTREVKIMRFGK
jgi:DNA polymerase II small subunit